MKGLNASVLLALLAMGISLYMPVSAQQLQDEIAALIDSNDNLFKGLLDQYKYADNIWGQSNTCSICPC